MGKLRVLVVEDAADWRTVIAEALSQAFGRSCEVKTAKNAATGAAKLGASSYDLVVMDLRLERELDGLDLLRRMRRDGPNRAAAAVVLTGNPSEKSYNQALRELDVFHFMEKGNPEDPFDEDRLVAVARAAIVDARVRLAEARLRRPCLTLRFNDGSLLASELTSSDVAAPYALPKAIPLLPDPVERADNLAYLFSAGPDRWRREMKRIGTSLYGTLATDPRLLASPMAAVGPDAGGGELWLRFSGPASGLGIPFELLNDGGRYLCREHVLTRQLVHAGPLFSHRSQPFCQFLRALREAGEPLRILLVAANSDGKIPGVDAEVEALAANLAEDLRQLDLRHQVDVLPSRRARLPAFEEAVRGSRYHLLHYAGHGRRSTTLPEVGGLILRDRHKLRALTAADMNELFQGSELRLVFLSSCFGAYSAEQPGRGDFHGVFDALAGAGVPTIVGHRWAVPDEAALTFAVAFYSSLWRTLSPGDAVLAGRRACAREWGLDVETWASPILLQQSA